MQRERVSENVYWFQSEVYAQVTAGAVIGPQWAVLIDTLIPQETSLIKDFLEKDLMVPVRYIIDSHHHADHSWGNSFFPDAIIIGHSLCRELMLTKSRSALEEAGQDNPFLRDIAIVPPHITFSEGTISLRVGKKQLQIFCTSGHTADSISVLVEEDRILFAGDAFMAVPYIVGGSLEEALKTINHIGKMSLENIVQGHGDIILRGEIEDACASNLAYLHSIQKIAKAALRRRDPLQFLQAQDIEASGKSRVSLGGVAEELHQNNLRALFKEILREREAE
jgi:glyoxylase-like metal-dependent hydrolase (beta-lactamase superfamily II)